MMWPLPRLESSRTLKRIALLTSGGDAPGMNAAVRAVVRTALECSIEVFGVQKGYSGLVHGKLEAMDRSSVANILHRGGTVLKTDRSEDFRRPDVRRKVAEDLRARGIEALVVIGGDGSLSGAHLFEQETGILTMGLPGTIDNDVYGTEDTIGFDTAVNTALEAIDRIRDTATSHERVFLVEVMGRSSGFIAASVGIAGGAEIVVPPGVPVRFDDICRTLKESERRGKYSSLIVVAEGEDPNLTPQLTKSLGEHGFQARAAILGHIQRGGSPSGHDRVLASVLGASAVEHLLAGHSDIMLGVRAGQIVRVSLADIMNKKKPMPEDYIELAKILAT
jgi:6-phosphofructokinase 1